MLSVAPDSYQASGNPTVAAWHREGVLFERYRYPAGPAGEAPKHAHAEYQLCFSVDSNGRYEYRGGGVGVPAASVSILHHGEAHSARDPEDRGHVANYLVMYVPPGMLAGATAELFKAKLVEPFFRQPVIRDPELSSLFMRVHSTGRQPGAALEHDVLRVRLFSLALARCVKQPAKPIRSIREAQIVRTAIEYIDAHFAQGISLRELAVVAQVGQSYLIRAFSRTVGVPPHRYQLQVRVDTTPRRYG